MTRRAILPLICCVCAALLAAGLVQALKAQATDEPASAMPASPAPKISLKDLISDQDISRIRLYELGKDETVSIDFKNDVLERFIRSQSGTKDEEGRAFDANRFRRRPRSQQLQYMLQTRPDDTAMLDDIIIKSDPRVLKEFQSSIWPMIGANCGQMKCHGSPKGQGQFALIRGGGPKVVYTNFLILSLWQDASHHKIIDRGNNEDSLLLQYGLPADVASQAHPHKVKAVMFPSMRSSNYRKMAEWIARLKGASEPDYRTTYQPPVGAKLHAGGVGPTTTTTSTSGPGQDESEGTDEGNPFLK